MINTGLLVSKNQSRSSQVGQVRFRLKYIIINHSTFCKFELRPKLEEAHVVSATIYRPTKCCDFTKCCDLYRSSYVRVSGSHMAKFWSNLLFCGVVISDIMHIAQCTLMQYLSAIFHCDEKYLLRFLCILETLL